MKPSIAAELMLKEAAPLPGEFVDAVVLEELAIC